MLLPVVGSHDVDARNIAWKGRGVGPKPVKFRCNVVLPGASYLVCLSQSRPSFLCAKLRESPSASE